MNLPVILVPGLAGTGQTWKHQTPILSRARQVDIIEANRLGPSISSMAQGLLERAPEKFMLVGSSMGGMIAIEAARQQPRRIAALALVATSARPCPASEKEERLDVIERAKAGGPLEALMAPLDKLVHPRHAHDEALPCLLRNNLRSTTVDEFVAQQSAMIDRPDNRSALNAIACPTLVIAGAADPLFPACHAAEIAACIDRSTLTVIDKAGHLVTWEAVADVNEALLAWSAPLE